MSLGIFVYIAMLQYRYRVTGHTKRQRLSPIILLLFIVQQYKYKYTGRTATV